MVFGLVWVCRLVGSVRMNSEISALESPHAGDWALYRRLLKYLKGQWLLFVVAVVGFLLGAGAEAFFCASFRTSC